jgi:hypothetical protein
LRGLDPLRDVRALVEAYEGAIMSFCAVISCPYRNSPYKREWGEER